MVLYVLQWVLKALPDTQNYQIGSHIRATLTLPETLALPSSNTCVQSSPQVKFHSNGLLLLYINSMRVMSTNNFHFRTLLCSMHTYIIGVSHVSL